MYSFSAFLGKKTGKQTIKVKANTVNTEWAQFFLRCLDACQVLCWILSFFWRVTWLWRANDIFGFFCKYIFYIFVSKNTATNNKIIILPTTVNRNGEKCRMNILVFCWFFCPLNFLICAFSLLCSVTQVFFEETRKK